MVEGGTFWRATYWRISSGGGGDARQSNTGRLVGGWGDENSTMPTTEMPKFSQNYGYNGNAQIVNPFDGYARAQKPNRRNALFRPFDPLSR